MSCVFFLQAEDAMRYYRVTGVQSCALPISQVPPPAVREVRHRRERDVPPDADVVARAGSETPPRAGDGRTIAQVVIREPKPTREEEASRRGGVVIHRRGDVANALLEAAARFVPCVDGAAQKDLWAERSAKLEE